MNTQFDQPAEANRSGIARACERIVEAVKTAVHDAAERHRLAAEFATLAGGSELDAVLHDAGLSRYEMRQLLAGHAGAPRLLQGMTERLGIDLEAINDPASRREIERSCALCNTHKQCRKWLRTGTGPDYHAFCPNAETFDALGAHGPEATAAGIALPQTAKAQSEASARRLDNLAQLPYI